MGSGIENVDPFATDLPDRLNVAENSFQLFPRKTESGTASETGSHPSSRDA